jgi:HlyD family secretion protein
MSLKGRQLQVASRVRKAFLGLSSVLALVFAFIIWLELRKPARAFVSSVGFSSSSQPSGSSKGAVGCLGYIEPQDGMLQVMAAYFEGRPQRVLELKVKEGDKVRAAQLLAILDGREQLQSAVRLADARVALARARLSQVKAGASASDVAAQKAAVSQIQAALENARSEYHRFEVLRQQTDVSTAELDARRLAVQTDEQKLEEAEERLKSISEVRPTDIDVAQSELGVAIAEAERTRLNLKSAMVYAPTAGQIVKIHAYPGEELGPQGLLDLGKTDSMYVAAEVYESDIARVHTGQNAIISSDLFPWKLSGVVDTVGTTIAKADVLPLDPVSFADARVFKVWIRLNDGRQVASLIHGKVNVVIQP